ncbi:MAG: ferrochelatase, partial [Saprospiraceae bacterium]|nr:ferrochelatase [Saprospiraceae bacterium]
IEAGLEKLYSQNVSKIVVLTLFPQYASATVGSVHEEVMRIVMKKQIIPNISFINSYPDYKPVIDVFVKNALQFDLNKYDHFIFSFHGLPVRQLFKADHNNVCKKDASCCDTCTSANQFCYKAQCFRTARAIAQGLKLDSNKYTICFQSRLGREEWITPYTSTVLKDRAAAGDKHLLVFSPSFVADCLETLVEIADEYQEEFIHLGGKSLDLVPSLNDDDIWISGLAALINNNH